MLEGVVWMDGGQFQVVVVASIPALFISWPASQANPLWVVLGQGGQRPLPFISIFNYRSVRSPSGVGPSGWRSLHHPRWSPWAESLKGGKLLLGIAIYSECLLAERHPICTPLKASDSKASFIVVVVFVGQSKPHDIVEIWSLSPEVRILQPPLRIVKKPFMKFKLLHPMSPVHLRVVVINGGQFYGH